LKVAGRVEVIPATADQKPALANLLELYVHDFSEFTEVELGADGRFGYASLPLYWQEPDRRPFLIRVDGKLAGLALICRSQKVWDMAEFFVVRGYRRQGVGMEAAQEVWRRLPGRWQIRVMESNAGARRFWESAIAQFVGWEIPSMRVVKAAKCWDVFSFESSYAN
jgi:predicted acetyltransferase